MAAGSPLILRNFISISQTAAIAPTVWGMVALDAHELNARPERAAFVPAPTVTFVD